MWVSMGLSAGKLEDRQREGRGDNSWTSVFHSVKWDMGVWTKMVPSSWNILDYKPREKGQAGRDDI